MSVRTNALAGAYVREIDGLRALAVLSVIIYHLVPAWLPGGFTGVDIFFVISGYVVSRALASRPRLVWWHELADFFARRVRRIMPALLLCLLLTTLLTVLLVPESWLSSTTSQTGMWAIFGFSNVALVLFQDGYFSPRAEYNPFIHTWSLAVEEQFYLVFPLLFLFWGRAGLKNGMARFLAIGLWPVLLMLSFLVAWWWGQHAAHWAYYLLPSRFWELAAGVMLFQLQASGRLGKPGVIQQNLLLFAGLTLVVTGLFLAEAARFPYPWAVVPVLGTVFLIAAVSVGDAFRLAHYGFGNRLMVQIGQMSYSLYLWHWPVYTLFRWTVGLEQVKYRALAVLLTFALAWLSWRFVERPIRHARMLISPNWRSLVSGGVAAGLALVVANSLFINRERLSLSVTADTFHWYPYSFAAEPAPGFKPLADRQVFVIGNSHAAAYTTMLDEASRQLGVKVRLHAVGTCPMGSLMKSIEDVPGCPLTVTDLMQMLASEAKPGDMVFFASLRTYRLNDQWVRFSEREIRDINRSQAEQEVRQRSLGETEVLLKQLADLQIKVLIDAPKPVLQAPPFRCSDWFNRSNPVCGTGSDTSRALLEELRAPVVVSLEQLQKKNGNLTVWDPFPVLCPDVTCHAFDHDGKPLFFDGDHLSAHGNRVLYPYFEKVLRKMYGI